MDILELILLIITIIYLVLYIALFIYEFRFKSKLFKEYETEIYLGASFRQRLIFSIMFLGLSLLSIIFYIIKGNYESAFVTISGVNAIFGLITFLFIFSDLSTMALITKKELILIVKRKELYRIALAKLRYVSVHKKGLTTTYIFYDKEYNEVYATDEGFDHMDLLFSACHCKVIKDRHSDNEYRERLRNKRNQSTKK